MLYPWISVLSTVVFMGLLLCALPWLSRRTHWFAVTVSPTFRDSEEAGAIVRRYVLGVVVAAAAAVCCIAALISTGHHEWFVVAPAVLLAGWVLTFRAARSATLAYAVPVSAVRVASLSPRAEARPVTWLLWVGPFALLALAAVYTALHWDQIPARFATHWGFNGQPDAWAERTPGGVYQPLLHGFLTCGLLALTSWQIASNSRGSSQTRRFTSRLLVVTGYAIAALFGWLTIRLPLASTDNPTPAFVLSLAFPIVVVGASLLFASRRRYPEPPGDADSTADRYWKGGLIYYNPNDPALFVEKRIGIGYDLNFGNRLSWLLIGAVALMPLLALLLRG